MYASRAYVKRISLRAFGNPALPRAIERGLSTECSLASVTIIALSHARQLFLANQDSVAENRRIRDAAAQRGSDEAAIVSAVVPPFLLKFLRIVRVSRVLRVA